MTGSPPGWRELAESTREALRLLGYGTPDCLPGEPGECGGSYAEHATAHLAALRAVVNQRITHLEQEARAMVREISASVAAKLAEGDDCDQGHGHEVTVTLALPPGAAARLAALAQPGEGAEGVLAQLADHAQQAVYRPGSWERGWICQALGDSWLARIEPDDVPASLSADGGVIFGRPRQGRGQR